FPLSGGNFLKMTTGRWYTPVGRSIQKESSASEEEMLALLEEEEAISDEGHPIPAGEAIDTVAREAYTTDSGRIVYGGGGIVPDLIVRQDTMTDAEREFFTTIARGGSAFNDAIFRFAVDFVRENPDLEPNFPVTDAMLDRFYDRLVEGGVEIDRAEFDGADSWLRRRIGQEVALAKF